jgi:hypothetical protein
MKTPAGKECNYFYGNYHRGKSDEECRLLPAGEKSWTSKLCATCPVPGYQQANSCESMRYNATVTRSVFNLFQQRVEVQAYCSKITGKVDDPHIGCGQCHPKLNFIVK